MPAVRIAFIACGFVFAASGIASFSAGLALRKADLAARAQDWDSCKSFAQRAVARNRAAGYGWYYLGVSEGMAGSSDSAIENLRRASATMQNPPVALFSLGEIAAQAGRAQEAAEALSRALLITPRPRLHPDEQ